MARITKAQIDDIFGKARACRICAEMPKQGCRLPDRRRAAGFMKLASLSTIRASSGFTLDGVGAETFYNPKKIAILPTGFCGSDCCGHHEPCRDPQMVGSCGHSSV